MFDSHAQMMIPKLEELDRRSTSPQLVLLGDSHFELMDTSLLPVSSINLGIRGDSVTAIAQRGESYKSVSSGNVIALSLGTNNVALNVKDTTTVRQIVELIERYPDKTFLLALLNPLSETQGYRDFNQRLLNINEGLIESLSDNSRVWLIPPIAPLSSGSFRLSDDYYIEDGIHLSKKGYQAWINQWKPALDAVFPEDSSH